MTTTTLLAGIWVVLVTLFAADGELDQNSLRSEIQWILAQAATGVVAFGLASEAYTLTDTERNTVLRVVAEECEGKSPWIAGVEHTGTRVAALRSAEAFEAGASALMAYPPYLVKPTDVGIIDYYRAIATRAPIPIIIQDAEPWTRVPFSVPLIKQLAQGIPNVCGVKIETPPTGFKVSAVRAAVPEMVVLGGLGGLYAYDVLQRGAHGFLIGPTQTRDFVSLLSDWAAGKEEEVAARYTRLLPGMLTSMPTLDTYIQLQKEQLCRLNIIADAQCRSPHQDLDEWQWRAAKRWLGITEH